MTWFQSANEASEDFDPDEETPCTRNTTASKNTKPICVLESEIQLHKEWVVKHGEDLLLPMHIVCLLLFEDVSLLQNFDWRDNTEVLSTHNASAAWRFGHTDILLLGTIKSGHRVRASNDHCDYISHRPVLTMTIIIIVFLISIMHHY